MRNLHDERVQFRPNGKILKNTTIFTWAWHRVRGGLHKADQSICRITPDTSVALTDNSPISRTPNCRPFGCAASIGACLLVVYISISFSSTCRLLRSKFSNGIIKLYLIGCIPINSIQHIQWAAFILNWTRGRVRCLRCRAGPIKSWKLFDLYPYIDI